MQKDLLGIEAVRWSQTPVLCWLEFLEWNTVTVPGEAELCSPAQWVISGCWIQHIGISSASPSEDFWYWLSLLITVPHDSSLFSSLFWPLGICKETSQLSLWDKLVCGYFQILFHQSFHCLLCYFSRASGLWCQWEMSFIVIISWRNNAFPFSHSMFWNMLWAIFTVSDY